MLFTEQREEDGHDIGAADADEEEAEVEQDDGRREDDEQEARDGEQAAADAADQAAIFTAVPLTVTIIMPLFSPSTS